MSLNVNYEKQKNLFVVLIVPSHSLYNGYHACSRAKMFACNVRDYAVLMRSVFFQGLELPTMFFPTSNGFQAYFVTTSVENTDRLYSEAEALGLTSRYCLMVPSKDLQSCERFPLNDIPN